MTDPVPYDAFADIYDAWAESAPITQENQKFYVKRLVEADGPAVELGVGNGRICIEAAKRGKAVIGVDSSEKILELCEARARTAGVLDRLTLIKADFRDFELPEPAALITIPFHSIGHLIKEEDKRRALETIRGQLRSGGYFIFDHFIFDPDYPQESGVPHLRANRPDWILWEATTRDIENQLLNILVWTDELDRQGIVTSRRYRRIRLSWITPEQSRNLLQETGFAIEDVYGDFEGRPLEAGSTHQIWLARRE